MKTPTIYEIKRFVVDEPYFFERKAMKIFGQTLRDFHVNRTQEAHIFYIWAKYGADCQKGKTERYYNANTRKFYFTFEQAKNIVGGE